MTITTMEALDALPEGAQIRLRSPAHGNVIWTRGTSGWVNGSGTVSSMLLIGYAVSGRITRYDTTPLSPGDWFTLRRYTYHFTNITDAGQYHMIRYNSRGEQIGESDYDTNTFNAEEINRLDQPPEYILTNATAIRNLLDRYMTMIMNQQAQITTLREQVAAKPEPVKEELPHISLTIDVEGRVVSVTTNDADDDDEESTVIFGG